MNGVENQKRNRNKFIIAMVAWGCGTVIMFAIMVVMVIIMWVEQEYKTTDIAEYGKYKGNFLYEKVLLPEEVPLKAKVIEYQYMAWPDILDDNQYIRLVCQYDDVAYQKEKERIIMAYGEEGTVTYHGDLFEYPAYVYIFDIDNNCEYALIDDKTNTIYYIYAQYAYMFDDAELYMRDDIDIKID